MTRIPTGRGTVSATPPAVPCQKLHVRTSGIGDTRVLRCGYLPTTQAPAATFSTPLPGWVGVVALLSPVQARSLVAPAPREPPYMQFTPTRAPHDTPASKSPASTILVHPNTTLPPATAGTTVQVGFQLMVRECRTDGGSNDNSVCGAVYYPNQHVPDRSGDISGTSFYSPHQTTTHPATDMQPAEAIRSVVTWLATSVQAWAVR